MLTIVVDEFENINITFMNGYSELIPFHNLTNLIDILKSYDSSYIVNYFDGYNKMIHTIKSFLSIIDTDY